MKLKIGELSLITALVVALLWGFLLDNSQQQLTQQVIRMHVVPHSDAEIDQQAKLHIRDNVQEHLRVVLSDASDKSSAESLVHQQLDTLHQIAADAAADFGLQLPVQVLLTEQHFPTRAYGHFTLPAGAYTALQIQLGDASGENWWCVVFPPMCFDVALGTAPDLAVMGFEEGEIALIADDSDGTAFRFRLLEVFAGLRG